MARRPGFSRLFFAAFAATPNDHRPGLANRRRLGAGGDCRRLPRTTLPVMSRVLIVADEPWVVNEVHAALSIGDNELVDHPDPATVADALLEEDFDVAVVDLQVASMGGIAVVHTIRNIESPVPVVLLLDREADVFLAGRAGASAWVTKPFTASALRAAISDVTGAA